MELKAWHGKKLLIGIGVLLILSISFFLYHQSQSGGDEQQAPFQPYSKESDSKTALNTEKTAQPPEIIWIDLKGAVKSPGVYQLQKGARVYELIKKGGGFLPEAEERQVNLAQPLLDGEMIYIPAKGESPAVPVSGGGSSASGTTAGVEAKVNINRAGVEELAELPGIGPGKAAAIIEYRTKQGGFKKIEEITEVTGIGDKTFEKLKERITVY